MSSTISTPRPARARAIETETLPQPLRVLRDVIAVAAIIANRSPARAEFDSASASAGDYDGRVRPSELGHDDRLPGQLRA
jgi:hypothetical protein